MEIGAADQFDAGALRQEAAQPSSFERIGNAADPEAPFFIKQSVARLEMPADAIDDPESAG